MSMPMLGGMPPMGGMPPGIGGLPPMGGGRPPVAGPPQPKKKTSPASAKNKALADKLKGGGKK